MTTYLDVRNEATRQIKEAFKGVKHLNIESHPGNFDEADIRRQATRSPSILNSLIRIMDNDVNDESWCEFVSWVLYRANNQDKLYDGALKIISTLIPVIRNLDAPWSINGGTSIDVQTLYSGSMDSINITLWAVKWRWQVRGTVLEGEGGILSPDDLDWFEGYEADHIVDDQHVEDNVDLEV